MTEAETRMFNTLDVPAGPVRWPGIPADLPRYGACGRTCASCPMRSPHCSSNALDADASAQLSR